METFFRKSLFFTLAFGLLLGVGISSVSASTAAPEMTLKKKTDTSATFKVLADVLKNKSVKIKVKIKNNDTGKSKTQTFDATLDKKGVANVTVTGLTAEESYTFQGAIKKSTESDYSDYSGSVARNETGAMFITPSISIDDVSKTSVKLSVTVSDWKKKKSLIKVLVNNTDDDKIETRTFKRTLDSKGNTVFTLNKLSSDTEYTFSVAGRLISGSSKGFSKYSSEKVQKTEN